MYKNKSKSIGFKSSATISGSNVALTKHWQANTTPMLIRQTKPFLIVALLFLVSCSANNKSLRYLDNISAIQTFISEKISPVTRVQIDHAGKSFRSYFQTKSGYGVKIFFAQEFKVEVEYKKLVREGPIPNTKLYQVLPDPKSAKYEKAIFNMLIDNGYTP